MNNTHLYVGDRIVDLKPGQQVTISIKKIEIGKMNARFISYSNNLIGVWTENNAEIFGFINNESSLSSTPYQINSGKVIQNGIETIPQASVIIRNTDAKEFTINVYESVYDYFNEVNRLNINQIEPITNSAWDAAAIDSARTNTTGIVTVVLNWGKAGSIYQFDYFLPCFYYHSIIKAILEYTGLTISGDILTDSRFTDLVVPFPGNKFEYSESLVSPIYSTAQGAQSITFVDAVTPVKVDIDEAFFAGADNWSIVDDEWTAPITCAIYLTIEISLDNIVWDAGADGQIYFEVIATSGSLGTSNAVVYPDASGGLTLTISSTEVDEGDTIYINIMQSNSGADSVEVTTSVLLYALKTVNRAMVNWNALWPQITVASMLQDFFTRFSIIPKLVGQTLYLKSIEDICNDRAGATDWSHKLVNDNADINFSLNYAQKNLFKYTDSDTVNDPNLGLGTLEIENTALDQSKTIFTSSFENCTTQSTSGYNVATIPVYDSTSTGIATFANKPGLRLLTLKNRTDEAAITFNVSSRTDYKLGYFVDPSQTKDTGFEYFLGQFYTSTESSLQKNKVITRSFILSETDIAEYDPHKMVYYGEGYAIVNKIVNFIPGKITKVELFKII